MSSKFQKKVIAEYKRKGYFVLKLAKTNVNGIADLLCLHQREPTLLIECKERNDTIKPLQIHQNTRIATEYGAKFIVLQDGKGVVKTDDLIKKTDFF